MRAPLGGLTCDQCSTRLKDDTLLHTNPYFACGYTAQAPSAASGTVLRKPLGANSAKPLTSLKPSMQQPRYTHRAGTASGAPPMMRNTS